jgi:phage terminase large subunit-like protein
LTKRDQAKLSFNEAMRMIKKSPSLSKRVKIYKDNMNIEETASKFEPLGADADTLDGLNCHGILVDELHAHRTRAVWDVMETATGSRRQPLLIAITTAGFDQTSICYEQYNYAKNILDGVIQDDTYFVYIAEMDAEDDWTDPLTWQKCNPNFGISVKEDDLLRKCEKAKQIPAAQNNFLCKHLNKWTQQNEVWIQLDLWDANNGMKFDPPRPVIESALKNKVCYGGLDLSVVSDLTSWTLAFPWENDNEGMDFIFRLWCPEDRLYDKANRYRDQYQAWAAKGYLIPTPGNAVDYAVVKKQVLDDCKTFRIKDANVDRLFQGHQIAVELQGQGLDIVPMGMGFLSFAAPMVEFERRLLVHKLNHGGHPVARWAINNMSVLKDPAGNLKPDKANSQGKIDPIVTMIMALDRLMRHEKKKSIYETQGIKVFGVM